MKVILTSEFTSIAKNLLQKGHFTQESKNVAFIQNAADKRLDTGEIIEWVESAKHWYEDNGFIVEVVDLRDYADENSLYNKLSQYNYIHIHGGDIKHLSSVAQSSGLYGCIRKLLKQGITYIGSSAGSILAGNEISYAYIGDPKYTGGMWVTPPGPVAGLGIHRFHIMPHSDRIERKELAERRLSYCIENNYNPYITLTDHQAIVLDQDIIHRI